MQSMLEAGWIAGQVYRRPASGARAGLPPQVLWKAVGDVGAWACGNVCCNYRTITRVTRVQRPCSSRMWAGQMRDESSACHAPMRAGRRGGARAPVRAAGPCPLAVRQDPALSCSRASPVSTAAAISSACTPAASDGSSRRQDGLTALLPQRCGRQGGGAGKGVHAATHARVSHGSSPSGRCTSARPTGMAVGGRQQCSGRAARCHE